MPSKKKHRPKRILSDLNEDERKEAAGLEAKLLTDDLSIKEAVINPDTMPSVAVMHDDSSITDAVFDPNMDNLQVQGGEPVGHLLEQILDHPFPTPAVSREPSQSSTLPSRSEFEISPPSDDTEAYIKSLDLSESPSRGSSAGTSNEKGKFENQDDDQASTGKDKSDQEEVNQAAEAPAEVIVDEG